MTAADGGCLPPSAACGQAGLSLMAACERAGRPALMAACEVCPSLTATCGGCLLLAEPAKSVRVNLRFRLLVNCQILMYTS